MGLFSIGSLSKLYFLLSFVHGIRLYRRMIDMSREQNSEFEGPPLPFFHLLPGSGSFWFTRIVLEPAVVFVAATLLEGIFIFQSGLSTYLHFAALALAMKNFIGWYKAWEYLRQLMDMRFAAPIIAKLVENQATEDDLAPIHLASFPKNLSPDIRQAAVSHIARVVLAGGGNPECCNTRSLIWHQFKVWETPWNITPKQRTRMWLAGGDTGHPLLRSVHRWLCPSMDVLSATNCHPTEPSRPTQAAATYGTVIAGYGGDSSRPICR